MRKLLPLLSHDEKTSEKHKSPTKPEPLKGPCEQGDLCENGGPLESRWEQLKVTSFESRRSNGGFWELWTCFYAKGSGHMEH